MTKFTEEENEKGKAVYDKMKELAKEASLGYLELVKQNPETEPTGIDFMEFLLETSEALAKIAEGAKTHQCPTIHHIIISIMVGLTDPDDLADYSEAMSIVQKKKVEMKLHGGTPSGLMDILPEGLKEKLKDLIANMDKDKTVH